METEKLNQLENQANAKIKASDPFMPEAQTGPKKKGRPPKSSYAASSQTKSSDPHADLKAEIKKIPTKDLCVPLAYGLSGMAVNYVGHEKAAMNPDETEAFCIGLSMIIDKYMPDMMGKYGPEIVFASFLTQYGVRLYALKKVLSLEKQEGLNKMPDKKATDPAPTVDDLPQNVG